MLPNNFTRKLTQFKNPSVDQSPSGYMSYANQALSMIERNNEVSDFTPTKYPQTAGKSVKRNAPGTAILKNAKGILLDKKPRISRATTTQQQEVRSVTNINDSF